MIESNDKPRAEVIIDVQILEIARDRAKRYGLNLGSYQIGLVFSPEAAPDLAPGKRRPTRSTSTRFRRGEHCGLLPVDSLGGDQFPRIDSKTKVLAKTHLRGAENQKVSLNLGEEVPVPARPLPRWPPVARRRTR